MYFMKYIILPKKIDVQEQDDCGMYCTRYNYGGGGDGCHPHLTPIYGWYGTYGS